MHGFQKEVCAWDVQPARRYAGAQLSFPKKRNGCFQLDQFAALICIQVQTEQDFLWAVNFDYVLHNGSPWLLRLYQ